MKDVLHYPEKDGPVYVCTRCETELPRDACLVALSDEGVGVVVDLSSIGTSFFPAGPDDISTLKQCKQGSTPKDTHVMAECFTCAGEGCDDCNGNGVILYRGHGDKWEIADADLGLGVARQHKEATDRDVQFTEIDDLQKMVSRQAWANWVQMREMTRPDGMTDSA